MTSDVGKNIHDLMRTRELKLLADTILETRSKISSAFYSYSRNPETPALCHKLHDLPADQREAFAEQTWGPSPLQRIRPMIQQLQELEARYQALATT